MKLKISNHKFIDVFNDNFTTPTKKNPMMNVLMTDYSDNPERKMAAPSYNKRIAEKINDKSIKSLYENGWSYPTTQINGLEITPEMRIKNVDLVIEKLHEEQES